MKGGKGFAAGITIFILLMFALQLNMPAKFSWEPTFANKDKNPFGCYVFDSIMAQSMPKGYGVTKKTLYQISTEAEGQNVLIVTNDLNATATDMKAIRDITKQGGRVMIVTCNCGYVTDSLMNDSIGMGVRGYSYFNIKYLKKEIKDNYNLAFDTIQWKKTDKIYGEADYRTYSILTACHVTTVDTWRTDILAVSRTGRDMTDMDDKSQQPLAARRRMGKGEVIVVSTPLLFTNYGVLDGNTTAYVFRLMSQIADRRVVRTTAYMKTAEEYEAEQSPLRVFLKKPPLRTALYLTLGLIVLLMISNARRRQRIIPVVEPPQNRSLEFVQLVGTLYYQKKDHTDIVKKKFMFFADEIRRLLLVDVTDRAADSHTFDIIALRTGMERHEVEKIIKDIRRITDGEMEATEYGVKLYIDNMNMITGKIT